MSVLGENYKKIITEIEGKITNPEDLKFVKEKIAELFMSFMETVDRLVDITDEKIKNIEEKQANIENRINEIETDIYDVEDENNNFDFEIVCPYCDYEFTTSIEGRTEIVCPKCNNVIELDWNDDEEDDCCAGHCHSCHGCGEEEYDDNDYDEYEENDEDDDM